MFFIFLDIQVYSEAYVFIVMVRTSRGKLEYSGLFCWEFVLFLEESSVFGIEM
jgi:hypothetical protein